MIMPLFEREEIRGCDKPIDEHERDFCSAFKEENKTIRAELVIFHQKIRPMSFTINSFVDNNYELFNQILSTIH